MGSEESVCGEALGISSYSQALAAGLICLWLQPETRRAARRTDSIENLMLVFIWHTSLIGVVWFDICIIDGKRDRINE